MNLPFTNDAIVLGILISVLALIFRTASSTSRFWRKFYRFVPPLLLCYFIPALLHWPLGVISSEGSNLNFVSSRFLLPASLILLCLSIDLKGLIQLGPKALVMFLTATIGIVIGGPIALWLVLQFAPNLINVSLDEVWKALSTIAGSWIGGGGNQTAMKEIFDVGSTLFASMVIVDVVVANIWMGFLLYGAGITKRIDRWLKADVTAIEDLKNKVSDYQSKIARIPTNTTVFVMLAVAFGGVGLSHWGKEIMVAFMGQFQDILEAWRLTSLMNPFFWLVVLATSIGFGLSFTKAKKLEGVGASRWGSVFIYILVATIGMQMDLSKIHENIGFLAIGVTWMVIHVLILTIVAKIIKAPFFYIAVGSQANVGGVASAPIVASAFSTSLAPVGVLMAVLGYALGTYGAILCAQLMQVVAVG